LPLNTLRRQLGTGRIHRLWHLIDAAPGHVSASAPIVTGTTLIFVGDPY